MVSTRSGSDYSLIAILELSKITARKDEAKRKGVLGPLTKESRVTKTQVSSPSRTSRSTRGQQQKVIRLRSTRRKTPSPTFIGTGVQSKNTLETRKAETATITALDQEKVLSSREQKLKIIKNFTRETDTARTLQVVIRTGEYKGPTFKPPKDLAIWKKAYPRKKDGKDFFSNEVNWKVGCQPFMAWKGVETEVYRRAFHALQECCRKHKDKITLNVTEKPLLPGHTYQGSRHMFHSIIEPILSCATSNNNQKLGSNRLFGALTYGHGQQSKSSPNYHKLINMKQKELEEIVRPAGRYTQNAKAILSLFHNIREENIKRDGLTTEDAENIHKEAMDAEDWNEGLLSLKFLDGLSMQDIFDKLLKYRGLKCKTAACIMCFTFGFAVFAVDTHVYRQCQWLGWIPYGCTRDDAYKFLTLVIPPQLMRDLHQGFWHHGQFCFRCNRKTYYKISDPQWKDTVCPLEQFGINRFPTWELAKETMRPKNTAASKKPKKLADPGRIVTYTLKTEKDVAGVEAAGYEIVETEIDDAFGAGRELSNIKKELKRTAYIPAAVRDAFLASRKTTRPVKIVKSKQTKITKRPKAPAKSNGKTLKQTTTTTTTRRSRKRLTIEIEKHGAVAEEGVEDEEEIVAEEAMEGDEEMEEDEETDEDDD
jgi:endonuclease III